MQDHNKKRGAPRDILHNYLRQELGSSPFEKQRGSQLLTQGVQKNGL
jgi:hypothetical protein